MKCPICCHSVPDNELRCPLCLAPLTVWKNLDMYAEQAFACGLEQVARERLEEAAASLLKAVTFAPEEAAYLDTYGRVLGRLGRYHEAAAVLRRASRLDPNEGTQAALEKAEQLADLRRDALCKQPESTEATAPDPPEA